MGQITQPAIDVGPSAGRGLVQVHNANKDAYPRIRMISFHFPFTSVSVSLVQYEECMPEDLYAGQQRACVSVRYPFTLASPVLIKGFGLRNVTELQNETQKIYISATSSSRAIVSPNTDHLNYP